MPYTAKHWILQTLRLALLLSMVGAAATAEQSLVDFELRDQFGNTYSRDSFAGELLVILGADSAGSSFTTPWSTAMQQVVEERGLQARFVGLADLRSVPSFMRRSIRDSFSQQPEEWVLLDWKGAIAKAYGFEGRHCNMLLFADDGSLLFQGAGREVDEAMLGRFDAALEDLVQ